MALFLRKGNLKESIRSNIGVSRSGQRAYIIFYYVMFINAIT